MAADSIRAFANPDYDYYRLTKDFGMLKAGTMFYHDPDDHVYGSLACGCLKNCWMPDGNCENMLCGGTVILHYDFSKTDWFEKVERTAEEMLNHLNCGHYEMDVHANGTWEIRKLGSPNDAKWNNG